MHTHIEGVSWIAQPSVPSPYSVGLGTLRAAPDQHGYEAWWKKLCAEYEPTTSTRTAGMIQALCSPDFRSDLQWGKRKCSDTNVSRGSFSAGDSCVCSAEKSTNRDSLRE
eukprot:3547490-Amphidinium_carterae.1